MRVRLTFFGSLLLIVACMTVVACSSKESNAPPLALLDPSLGLQFAETAIEKSGGYRLTVEESNFVLPRWGGVDGGTVEVNKAGDAAIANLTRTGEANATYTITLVKGETYFKRSTCDQTFHITNGAGVLKPFLLAKNNLLSNAKNAKLEGDVIRADLEGIGSVTVALDKESYLPREIRGTSNGRDLVWTFDQWHAKPKVSKPSGKVEDGGPGGNPC